MNMSRKMVLVEFCDLSTWVMGKAFNYSVPADGFCDHCVSSYGKEERKNFCFGSEITEYIRKAVKEKMEREEK